MLGEQSEHSTFCVALILLFCALRNELVSTFMAKIHDRKWNSYDVVDIIVSEILAQLSSEPSNQHSLYHEIRAHRLWELSIVQFNPASVCIILLSLLEMDTISLVRVKFFSSSSFIIITQTRLKNNKYIVNNKSCKI